MRTTTLLRSVLAAMMVMLCSAVGATDAPKVNTSALSAYDKNAPIGFGASITGSGDENPVTVTTLAELTNALTGTDAKTIYVSGTITFTGLVEISDVQNKTIYGLEGATFENLTHSDDKAKTGILKLTGCDNIIIRNITFKGAGAYDIDGNDNLTLSGSTNIWIDHCDFQDGVDGNLDCNNGSDNICVSWCRFRYLISPWSGGSGGSKDHRFSNLWGGGDTATGDEGKLNTTFYACWWDDGCKQRMPRVRFGKVHILNCLYSSSVADYCIGAGYKSNLYVENSVFNVSSDKVWQCYATSGSYTDYNIKLVGNSGAADDTKSSGSITQFEPTYNYTAIAASDVQAAVTAANGAGATLSYSTWRDIKVDLTNGNLLEESEQSAWQNVGPFGIAVAENGTVSRVETNSSDARCSITGKWHSTNYGWASLVVTVPVYGPVKISLGTNNASGEATVLNGDQPVATLNISGNNWDPSYPDRVAVAYYDGEATTLTINAGSYQNYFAIEAVDASAVPSTSVVTFGLGESGAEGTVPAAIEVSNGEKITIPANRTLWVEGKTLTAWTDGTNQYNVGQEVTVNANITLTPEFTTNTVAFADRTSEVTAIWDFQQKNGAPVLEYQNKDGFYVTQITVNDKVIDFRLDFRTNNGGKLNNKSWQDWAQVNTNTEFTLPAYKGTAFSTYSMYDNSATTFAGEAGTYENNVNTYTYNGSDATIDIVITDGSYYRWVKAVYPVPVSEEPQTGTAVSVYWPMDTPANYTDNTVTPSGLFTTVNVDLGDVKLEDADGNENKTGTSNVSSGVTFSQMHPKNSGSDYVTWQVKPVAGLTFTPKKISAYIVRFGTDVEHGVTFSAKVGTGNAVTLGTYTAPRNNKSKDDDKFGASADYAENGYVEIKLTSAQQEALASGETFSLMGTIGVGNAKTGGIAKVTIEGEVTGSIQNFTTVYDLATAMMSETNNFEGNTGSLAPTTAEADANAPSILVDATSGKLGKNNNDWAQLNAGTMLTIPGVPEGAQVTFALYNTTALTIDGVAYTNGQTFTATKDVNLNMTCTTGGYIKSITVEGPAFVEVSDNSTYTNTWYFGKSNGAPEFALQKSAEYTYTVEGYSLVINTDAGKLNNARADQWAQCNDGTTFKVPVFEGSKLTWGRYNGGSESGFTIDGQLYPEYYIATEEGTVNMTAKGISYLSYIKIEPATLYEITGTVSGGDINGQPITFTATGNGQPYSATVAENAFTLKVPAGKYTIDLTGDAPYVVSSPLSVDVDQDAAIGEVTITAALPQQVTGHIVNAPAEAFTLTFTATNNASHTQTVNCSAGETAYNVTLDPDTYTISSDKGTLSPLSQESFKVLKSAVQFGIYYPEAAVPAATQQNITVDNTAAVAANVYNTVTDALAAAKAGNISKPIITLTSNQTYREQVIVDQADVTLKTSGEDKATITFYYGIGYAYYSLGANGYYDKDRAMTRHSIKMIDPARWGASVLVTNKGNNFRAENIVFENSFNRYYTDEEVLDGVTPNGVQSISYDRTLTDGKSGYQAADAKAVTERAAAIAFENNPTGVELYNCTFIGSQDTYYTSGTMYVKDCNIVGNTDYIFGGGYVVFDNCDLTIGGYSDKETSAYITAYNGNGRYIFRDCTVKSGGRTYVKANLGRDWGGTNASVYYFNLKNEIGNKLEYKWQNMGGAVSAGTADMHIYDFDPTVNANYSTTGSSGANINGVLSEANALTLYGHVVTSLGFTPERIYADAVELSESSAYNKCRIAASDVATRNVTLTRSITGGNWSTICLPFGMTAAQVTATFGTDTKLATIRGYNSDTKEVTTASATTIAANTPCFIKVADNVSEGTTIEGVTFVSGEPEIVIDGDFKYVGVYSQTDMASGDFFLASNKLYKATENTKAIKPFRAYFTGVPANARILFTDGEATRIDATLMGGDSENGDVYDLQGRRVERPVKKGLYINGGRKVIIK